MIKSYIQDLLYRYDCVIIPGFGGFVANKMGATIEGEKMYPPSKKIAFNAQLTHNDGLFVNHVASVEQCSFKEATGKVAQAVTNWKSQLESQPLHFDGLGIVSLNEEQQLIFEPSKQLNFDVHAFGLSSMSVAKVSIDETAVIPIATTTAKEGHQRNNLLKYAAGAAILIAGYVGVNSYVNNSELQSLANEQNAIEQKIQKATFVINDQLPTVNLNVTKETHKVHIIAGAFQLEKNATKKIKQLTRKGYEAKILGKNEWGLTQVSLGSYATKSEADAVIETIRKEVSSDAWILIQQD